jgi:hypothetical protein
MQGLFVVTTVVPGLQQRSRFLEYSYGMATWAISVATTFAETTSRDAGAEGSSYSESGQCSSPRHFVGPHNRSSRSTSAGVSVSTWPVG